MEYLLIDGYNVINAWKDIFDLNRQSLEDCRDKFLEIISNYQGYSNTKIFVVFDAHKRNEWRTKTDTYDNITIVYTKKNQTADHYIERFVYKLGKENIVSVVTSDYLEQRIVLSGGGVRITPKEFRQEIINEKARTREKITENPKKTNNLVSGMSRDVIKRLEEFRRGRY